MATYEFGFIGAGNMAEGIIAAAISTKLYSPGQIIVSDPVPERRAFFEQTFGITATDDNTAVARDARRIVWAVKPQQFADVAGALADVITGDQLQVSIMAGVACPKIEALFPKTQARVVRVMPNLPIKVGAGVAGLCGGTHATQQDVADVQALLEAGGGAVVVDSESLMDAVTAVSGSGPAYFYYFVESMVAGGVACGLKEEDALKLAEQTCLGAARMMLETGEPPAELRRKVTSKGGTTQAALEHMERTGVGNGIRDAVQAAFNRGRELGS